MAASDWLAAPPASRQVGGLVLPASGREPVRLAQQLVEGLLVDALHAHE
jgi:hypothetical protein